MKKYIIWTAKAVLWMVAGLLTTFALVAMLGDIFVGVVSSVPVVVANVAASMQQIWPAMMIGAFLVCAVNCVIRKRQPNWRNTLQAWLGIATMALFATNVFAGMAERLVRVEHSAWIHPEDVLLGLIAFAAITAVACVPAARDREPVLSIL